MKNSKHSSVNKGILLPMLAVFLFFHSSLSAQDTIAAKNKRLTPTLVAAGTAYVGGLSGLYFLWYADYPQSSFHSINDNAAWLQVDKLGHISTAYHLGRSSYSVLKWAGMPERKAVWTGALGALAFQTSVEVLDGFSTNWGFSWGDFSANLSGSALFVGQQLLWKEQRISLKFSYFPTKYTSYNPSVLGANFQERILKDYNGQTYWLSVNVASFLPDETRFPKWLNVAFGYGAKGMINTYSNTVNGIDYPNFIRTRQFYLSLDVDLTKIKTQSEFLKTLLEVVGVIKIPFPTLEYNTENGFAFYPLYF